MKKLVLYAVLSAMSCLSFGQEKDIVQLSVLGGFTPYESSFGIGGSAVYSRILSDNVEIFGSANWMNGKYTTQLPNYSYDNSERVLSLDLGFNFNVTPDNDKNRLMIGIGGSIVQVNYEYGEFVFPERVEMNTVEQTIPMVLLRLEDRYFLSEWLFLSTQLSARTSINEEAVIDRSIRPSGEAGVSGGVRYFVNFALGLGYTF